MAFYGGQGVGLNLGGQSTNYLALQAGACMLIPPGFWKYRHGLYTTAQVYDPVMGVWRPCGSDTQDFNFIQSDGVNYRFANQSGCVVAALLTNAGSGYTSAPTVAFSAGGAAAVAVVGGAINTTITVTNGGTNYVYPPMVVIQAPPTPGVQATAYATLTAGAVSSITVTDQGAGYASPPLVALINDPRDTTGANATAVTTLTGAGTVTAVLVTNHGTAVTSIPTISFSGGGGSSAAATALMNWAVTAYTVTGGGSGYVGNVEVTTLGTGLPTTSPAYTNPSSQTGFLRTRPPIIAAALSSTAITATGQTLIDGGCIGGVAGNIGTLILATTPPATIATLALTVGGLNDFVFYQHA